MQMDHGWVMGPAWMPVVCILPLECGCDIAILYCTSTAETVDLDGEEYEVTESQQKMKAT